MTEYGKASERRPDTPIPGLIVWELPVHGDNRGWFKENWQREKMVAAGLPDFGPVQNNISFNDAVGHHPRHPRRAVGQVRLGGDRTDLRGVGRPARRPDLRRRCSPPSSTRRARSSCRAGWATRFRPWSPDTAYTYLVNDHWSPDGGLHLGATWPTRLVAIDWPIPLEQAELSEKDRAQPRAGRRHARCAAQDPGDRRGRATGSALRAAYADAVARRIRRPCRPRSGRRRPRCGAALARLRHDHQRRRVHRCRRGRDARRARYGVGYQRHRRRRAGAGRDRARHHAGARLQ